jgi:tetratricopeptide (TPR) repeat protein
VTSEANRVRRCCSRAIAAAIAISILPATSGVVLAAPGSPAPAQPDPRLEAKRLSASGQAHFDLGEYDAAIVDFKEAYRLFPSPGLLYNLGQAHRLKGDCGGALTMYRNYLRLEPDTVHREVVQKHIADMEACERSRKEAPEPATLPAPDAPPAQTLPAPRRRASSGGGLRLAGMITAGVGVVALGAGGYFAYDAHDAEGEVERRAANREPYPAYRDVDERGERSALLGAILLGSGGVALAAGATAYYLGWRDGREVPTVSVTPGPRRAQVVLSWAF